MAGSGQGAHPPLPQHSRSWKAGRQPSHRQVLRPALPITPSTPARAFPQMTLPPAVSGRSSAPVTGLGARGPTPS